MSRRMLVVMAVWAMLAGCSSDDGDRGDAWRFATDAGEVDSDESATCSTDSDCPDGWYCDDAVACGAPGFCVEGYSPCSAAPPFLVCGCDGVVNHAAAGCPGRFAWNVEGLIWDAQGQACDPAARPPFTYAVTAVIRDELPEGGEVLARLSGGFDPEPGVVAVPDRRTIRVSPSGDEWVSFRFDILIDHDANGLCDASQDEVFTGSVQSQTIDLTTFDVALEVEARPVEDCSRW